MPSDAPTLDTGRFKSAWIWFCLFPFLLLAMTGLTLIAWQANRNGLQDGFGIALGLLAFFTAMLGWAFIRALSRDRVWISGDSIRVSRDRPWGRQEKTVKISNVECFEVGATDILFDLRVRTIDGDLFPVAISHAKGELTRWTGELGRLAPMESRRARKKRNPSKK